MTVTPASDTGTLPQRLPFGDLPGFSALFRAYVEDRTQALNFFRHDRHEDGLDAAAESTLELERDRQLVSTVLEEQNRAWGNLDDAVRASLQALRQSDAVAVVTGQQLGLFGGPLFTIHKAVTAILLARRMSERQGRPVVPVFWLADEDHDWEEVRQNAVLVRDRVEMLGLPGDASAAPVGRRRVTEEASRIIKNLLAELPATNHTAWLGDLLLDAYQPGRCHRDAFAVLMTGLFRGTGLVIVSGDDARLKRLATPLFTRELEHPHRSFETVERTSTALEEAGFHAQVAASAGNLFLMGDELRKPLDPQPGGGYVARASQRRFTTEELVVMARETPERLSPNVFLRPLYEATILPTAAYLAGPGELAYYAQMRDLYAAFGVPMPSIIPRASITVVEPRVARAMDRLGLSFQDLGNGSGEVLEEWHRRLALARSEHEIEDSFGIARDEVSDLVRKLRPLMEGLDPTLVRSTESTQVRMQNALASLERKAVRAEKRSTGDVRRRLERVFNALMPRRLMQERGIGSLHLLNHCGRGFVEILLDEASLDVGSHQFIHLDR